MGYAALHPSYARVVATLRCLPGQHKHPSHQAFQNDVISRFRKMGAAQRNPSSSSTVPQAHLITTTQ